MHEFLPSPTLDAHVPASPLAGDSEPKSISSPDREAPRYGREWIESMGASGGAVLALLAVESAIGPVGRALSALLVRSHANTQWLEPTVGFIFVAACAVAGMLGGVACVAALRRFGKLGSAPVGMGILVAAFGLWRGRWLIWGAPFAVVAIAPLLAGGRAGPAASKRRDVATAAVCLGCESACFVLGIWFPFAGSFPKLLLPSMFGAAALTACIAAVRWRPRTSWRIAWAGMPLLALPLAGLARNPTLAPAVLAAIASITALWSLRDWPTAAARAVRWARRNTLTIAVPALVLTVILPWHFRELESADHMGHEAQHLGWINSILFGKLMMADAGFTYGPAREYALTALSWLFDGITLEHVRMAHVVLNLIGLLCLFGAMVRVAGGRVHLLFVAILLLVTHSSLVSLVTYTSMYSFGWADASRAGLAVLAVILALDRRPPDERRSRRRLWAAGALAGFAVLYSHDFGVPAVVATLLGLACESLLIAGSPSVKERVRAVGRRAGTYAVGIAFVLVPFLAVYAIRGRLLALFAGYAWTAEVSGGALGVLPWPLTTERLRSYAALTSDVGWGMPGTCVLDYLVAPAIAVIGLGHVALAVALRRFTRRTVIVAGLATFATMTLHHAFIRPDPWHLFNACTPGLVLLIALSAGGSELRLLENARRTQPLTLVLAALVPVVWLAHGASVPLSDRIDRITSGKERPSVGPPFHYDDLPRAGDVFIGGRHLDPVRYVREHSQPTDSVLCMTWELGGGIEAFLAERRNPIAFDKPDEILSRARRWRALDQLEKDPPLLIVGHYFDYLNEDTKWFIQQGWHKTYEDDPGVLTRNP